MTKYNYSTKIKENMAKAVLRSAPISSKQCIEICNLLRGKKLSTTKNILNDVIAMKKAVPFKRFNADVGHKPGIAAGRFPVKASEHILGLINSVEANAQFKGLDTGSLVLSHLSSQKGSRPLKQGRQRGRLAKRTTIEIVVEEKAEGKKKSEKKDIPKKEVEKVDPKQEVKKEAPATVSEVKSEPVKKEEASKPKPEIKEETPKTEEKKTEAPKESPKVSQEQSQEDKK